MVMTQNTIDIPISLLNVPKPTHPRLLDHPFESFSHFLFLLLPRFLAFFVELTSSVTDECLAVYSVP